MPTYTKFGDRGETALIGGEKIPKDHLRVEAYGSVDELNAILGLAISFTSSEEVSKVLERIQNDLFIIGAELATSGKSKQSLPGKRIEELETEIDSIEKELPELHNFIIPGGSKTASLLHLARTICRRAERAVVHLSNKEKVNPAIITYMNRVGDLLFVHARFVNKRKNIQDKPWKG